MAKNLPLVDRINSVARVLQMSDRRYLSLMSSLISWSGVNEELWSESFDCNFFELLELLLTRDDVMDDFLSHYYRGGLPRSLRQLQTRYVLLHMVSDLLLFDAVQQLS